MERMKKENKLILIVVSSLIILGITVLGIYLLLKNVVYDTTSDNDVSIIAPIPSNSITPDEIEEKPIRNDKLEIEISSNEVVFTNIPNSYNYKVNTTEYNMVINVSGRNIENNEIVLNNTEGIVSSLNAKTIGEDSIEIIINITNNFNFIEKYDDYTLNLTFNSSINENIFTYKNDTIRKYITIENARLSTRDRDNIKYYEEDISEDGLNYKIIIDKSRLPDVKDEKFVYNDELLNYINIYTEDTKKIIEFSAKKKLIYYPNTRDNEATITLIEPNTNKTLIFLDAGHGGMDRGATLDERCEKEITLNVALKAYDLLVQEGYNCYLIRETDEYVGINERIDIANLVNASIYINIHANSYDDYSVSGLLTMYKNDKDFARTFQNNLIKTTEAKDMGLIHTSNMVVTNKATMPAVILEMGFITNTAEWNKLIQDEYQNKIAEGLKNGVIEYINSKEE